MHVVPTNFAKPTPKWRHIVTSQQRISSYIDHHTPLHCSMLEFVRGHTIKQLSQASPDLFTPLTVPHWKKCSWKNFKWSGNPSPMLKLIWPLVGDNLKRIEAEQKRIRQHLKRFCPTTLWRQKSRIRGSHKQWRTDVVSQSGQPLLN